MSRAGDRYDFGVDVFRGWAYQDFPITGDPVFTDTTFTITDNENGDNIPFIPERVVNGSAIICTAASATPLIGFTPLYSGLLKLFSTKIKVLSHTVNTTVEINAAANVSWGTARVYYYYEYTDGIPLNYELPNRALSSQLYAEIDSLWLSDEDAESEYVPYVGANAAVNLGVQDFSTGGTVQAMDVFATARSDAPPIPASIGWNDTDGFSHTAYAGPTYRTALLVNGEEFQVWTDANGTKTISLRQNTSITENLAVQGDTLLGNGKISIPAAGGSIIQAVDGDNVSLSLRAKGTGSLNICGGDGFGTGGAVVYDGTATTANAITIKPTSISNANSQDLTITAAGDLNLVATGGDMSVGSAALSGTGNWGTTGDLNIGTDGTILDVDSAFGTVGINAPAVSSRTLTVGGTVAASADHSFIGGLGVYTPSVAGLDLFGLNYNPILGGSTAVDNLVGVQANVEIPNTYTGILSGGRGFISKGSIATAGRGTVTVSGHKHYTVEDLFLDESGGVITFPIQYGLYIEDLTSATANYAIKTGAGLVDIGDATTIGDGTNEMAVSGTGVASFNGTGGIVLPHMMQSDSTNQAVATANIAQVVTFNTDVHHSGITVTSSSRFTITKEAAYLIAISALVDTTVANKQIEVWLRVNGSDVANTNTVVKMTGTGEYTLAVTFIQHFDATDYFEFWMTGDNTACRLKATAAVDEVGDPVTVSARPACPSIIMTVNYTGLD